MFAFLYLRSRKSGSQATGHDKFEELFLKIREEIKSAVTPKFMSVSIEANEITDLAVEIWRIEQRIAKSASSLPENQLKGLENSIQKMRRYLEKYDIEIIDYKNHKYNDGLNLDILSVEKDPSIPEPMVKETVEPTIMLKGQVIRKAKIILLSNN
jgi:molecular chaperone GrpE (heat shock protein)